MSEPFDIDAAFGFDQPPDYTDAPTEIVKTFTIDLDAPLPETKSKDTILPVITPEKAEAHFARRWSPVYAYTTKNLTKGTEYTTFLYINHAGDITAQCDCPARVMCKHIVRSMEVHGAAIANGFIPKFDNELIRRRNKNGQQ